MSSLVYLQKEIIRTTVDNNGQAAIFQSIQLIDNGMIIPYFFIRSIFTEPGLHVPTIGNKSGIQVEELQQAKSLLEPLLGSSAAVVFALALLMAGISSTITSGMAAGSIFAGIFGESYHIKDSHSQVGVILSLGIALLLIFFIGDPFKGLLISQMILSIQLPFTVFLQVSLTSSRKVMGQYVNSRWSTLVLYTIAIVVTVLNIMLLISSL